MILKQPLEGFVVVTMKEGWRVLGSSEAEQPLCHVMLDQKMV